MLGIILASISTLFGEISLSIGKLKISQREESVYTMGFLTTLWATIFFLTVVFIKNKFAFAVASLPTFSLRAILEIAQAHITILAISKADRSTFGFIRMLTIPLLFATDIFLGYTINQHQILGMGLIIFTLFFIFSNRSFKKVGAWLVLFTALNATATLSLFKYDITHFNSVEAEQSLICIILMSYFFFSALRLAKENPLRFLIKPIFFTQSASDGIGNLLGSFAYGFAPASVILAAIRSSAVFWTMVSGGFYFREKHVLIKIICLLLLIAGIVLLIV